MSNTPAAQLARLKTHYGDRWQLGRNDETGACSAQLRSRPAVELTAPSVYLLEQRLSAREATMRR